MRIISKFKDYYDGGLAYGQDDSVVYVRLTEDLQRVNQWDSKKYSEMWERTKDAPYIGRTFPNIYVKPEHRPVEHWSTKTSEAGYIAFCGKIYPYYKMLVKNPDPKALYGERSMWVNSFDKRFDEYVFLTKRWRADASDKHYETYAEWFSDNSGYEDPGLNLFFNSPVVIQSNGVDLIVNPCLKNYDFQKVIDPFTAFQEISMFVGGVLTNNPTPPDTQSDKAKVVSHGFDPKYGFRTPPKEKK